MHAGICGVIMTLALAVTASLVPVVARAGDSQLFSGGANFVQVPEKPAEPVTISRDRAAEIARDATGGRVLSVELEDSGAYRVKVLLDGERVRTVHVDARSGTVKD